MDLITKLKYPNDKNFNEDYVNDLTKELDKHLIGKYPDYICTYIYGIIPDEHGWIAIRFPGATRGAIQLDENNVIQRISLYKDIRCYDNGAEKAVSKFIGHKLIIV